MTFLKATDDTGHISSIDNCVSC